MKVSIGTQSVLGIKKVKMDAAPTTAYLMLGTNCENNCLFCPQAKNSRDGENMLSRVSWDGFRGSIWELIDKAYKKKRLSRACIQVINEPGISSIVEHELIKSKKATNIPICISGGANSLSDVDKLIEHGADRVSIALDAATPEIYRKVKGTDYLKRLHLIEAAGRKYPGRIATHLIVGLGETEEEMIETIQEMYDKGVNVALFAFTPVKGTIMEFDHQPDIGSYRRIQIVHYLIKNNKCRRQEILCEKGRIKEFPMKVEELRELLSDGVAFMTSGCPGCNRPYYNEKPGSVMYNYPREMTREEIELAFEQCEV